MVVVVILGILAALVVPQVMSRPDQAKVTAAQNDIRAIGAALALEIEELHERDLVVGRRVEPVAVGAHDGGGDVQVGRPGGPAGQDERAQRRQTLGMAITPAFQAVDRRLLDPQRRMLGIDGERRGGRVDLDRDAEAREHPGQVGAGASDHLGHRHRRAPRDERAVPEPRHAQQVAHEAVEPSRLVQRLDDQPPLVRRGQAAGLDRRQRPDHRDQRRAQVMAHAVQQRLSV